MNSDVFICYSSKDEDFANKLVETLEKDSVKCWFAPKSILGGKKWGGEIMRALENCKTLLFILSKESNDSDNCLTELEAAKDRRIPIIPVKIEDVDLSYDIKYFIRSHQWIDAKNTTFESTYISVINSLKEHLNIRDNVDSNPGKDEGHQPPEKSNKQTETKNDIFKNPYILVHYSDAKLSSFDNIPAIDEISKSGRPLIIISKDFEGDAASFLKPHFYKGVMIVALVAPVGGGYDSILEDIAICTGGKLISEDIVSQMSSSILGAFNKENKVSSGEKRLIIESTRKSDLGQAESIKINQVIEGKKDSYNIIINGKGNRKAIEDRITAINHLITPKYLADEEEARKSVDALFTTMFNTDFKLDVESDYQKRINSFGIDDRSYKFSYAAENSGLFGGTRAGKDEENQPHKERKKAVRQNNNTANNKNDATDNKSGDKTFYLKQSLGIETLGGVLTVLVEAGTKLPYTYKQTFSTAVDNQPTVEVHLLSGNSNLAADCQSLGTFQLKGIKPAKKGIPQIEIELHIKEDGMVGINAKELETKNAHWEKMGLVDIDKNPPKQESSENPPKQKPTVVECPKCKAKARLKDGLPFDKMVKIKCPKCSHQYKVKNGLFGLIYSDL